MDNNKKKTERIHKIKLRKKEKKNKEDVVELDKNGNPKKPKFSKRHPRIAITIRIMLILFLAMIITGVIAVVAIIYGSWDDDFKITVDELVITGNSVILDSDGNVLAELSGDENRKVIKLEDMSEYIPKAYVAIEDERFYEHGGVDVKRTGGAILTFITHRGNSSFGGSTITQQLVKNITKEDDKSGIDGIKRKIREWAKAYQIEEILSKRQILELYLNIIYIGGGKNYHGVEVGAEYYFNKTAKELDLLESAFLAGINNTPNSYNPYGDNGYEVDENKTKKINNRIKTVLKKMLETEAIEQSEYDEAIEKLDTDGMKFEKASRIGNIYSYHTDATILKVISDLANEKNWSKEYASTYLYGGGITIYSTQNSKVQSTMEDAMQKNGSEYSKKGQVKNKDGEYEYSQAATVVIDNETGYAVGIVGGLGEKKESRGLNRATQSPRQTGSSFKPLADVLPALEEGLITAATMYDDCATEFSSKSTSYKPTDEGAYKGVISVRSAITTSQNIPFVKIMAEVTNPVSRQYLKKMGITTVSDKEDTGLSLAIGGQYLGVSTLEMAAAYGAIENDGVYREPLLYTKIVDSQGNTVLEPEQKTERVCSAQNAYILKDMLKSVVTNGTAKYCKLDGIDLAAKTGTTNDRKDRWLCGFSNYYSAATWYGYDTPEYIPPTGTSPASQIFTAVMKPLHKGLAKSTFTEPEGIETIKVCNNTGLKALDTCKETHYEIFVKGTEPEKCDEASSAVQICESSSMLATEFCPKTTTQYFSYTVQKERLGLWNNLKSSEKKAPTQECTEHTAQNSSDNAVPTLTLKGSENITLKVGEKYVEEGAYATDKIDGDISNLIIISGSVNTSRAGKYEITYLVKNSKGLETKKIRTIIVEEDKKENTTNTNTPTPTNTQADKPTETPTNTSTNTSTSTPTNTQANTQADKPTETPTNPPTNTQSNTQANTQADKPTNTQANTQANTPAENTNSEINN